MKHLYLKNRAEWRNWLSQHHDKSSGIWLLFYKKHTGQPTLEYSEAVEEALCFGWIDSLVKRVDDQRYVRKMTPRKAGSQWSELNKQRVAKLEQQGLMADAGRCKVNEAKASGLWKTRDRPPIPPEIPKELAGALAKNLKAKNFFATLAPSYQKQFVAWIAVAKRRETKARRVRESIALLERGEKLGTK